MSFFRQNEPIAEGDASDPKPGSIVRSIYVQEARPSKKELMWTFLVVAVFLAVWSKPIMNTMSRYSMHGDGIARVGSSTVENTPEAAQAEAQKISRVSRWKYDSSSNGPDHTFVVTMVGASHGLSEDKVQRITIGSSSALIASFYMGLSQGQLITFTYKDDPDPATDAMEPGAYLAPERVD